MAGINASDVKRLRDQTGAGMMDCKRALSEAEGDPKKAVALLRERGLAKAGKREGRATSEGGIATAVAGGAGAMVEVGCETDFVARTDRFVELTEILARAAVSDPAVTAPESLLEVSVDGVQVGDLIAEAIATLGENVVIKRVARLELDGVIGAYVHAGGKLGVIVGVQSDESGADALAKDVAMHVAAADPTPLALSREDISQEEVEAERSIYVNQAQKEGKPEKVIDKIVDGKIRKFISQVSLVDQPFVKDPDRSIGEVLGGATVTAFRRFKLGEASE